MIYRHEIPYKPIPLGQTPDFYEVAKIEALTAIAERLELVVEQLERIEQGHRHEVESER